MKKYIVITFLGIFSSTLTAMYNKLTCPEDNSPSHLILNQKKISESSIDDQSDTSFFTKTFAKIKKIIPTCKKRYKYIQCNHKNYSKPVQNSLLLLSVFMIPLVNATSNSLIKKNNQLELTTSECIDNKPVLDFVQHFSQDFHLDPLSCIIITNSFFVYQLIENLFIHSKELINKQIIENVKSENYFHNSPTYWNNSANTPEALYENALTLAPLFKEKIKNIATIVKGIANFGPNDEFITKSKKSLFTKINSMAQEKNTTISSIVKTSIRDAVRGTIIVDIPIQLTQTIKLLETFFEKTNSKILCKNLWSENIPSGYVAIHCYMLLHNSDVPSLMSEVQIHLSSIHNGSTNNVKEITHKYHYKAKNNSAISQIQKDAYSLISFFYAIIHTGTECQAVDFDAIKKEIFIYEATKSNK